MYSISRNRRLEIKTPIPWTEVQRTGVQLKLKPSFLKPEARPYSTAPPANHAATFCRSASVICVTFPNGIAFSVTAC